MNHSIRELTIDVAKENIFSPILAKQYDKNTRYILATITDYGNVLKVSNTSQVTINFKRPDGSSQSFYGKVEEDGRVQVPITYWALELDGKVTADISINGKDEKLTTLKFTITVEKATNNSSMLHSKIYGVSGIGQENPILTRTYDASNVHINIKDNGDYKECVADDGSFQNFFNFPEYTDELGNIFLTITPKSFRIDSTSNGEITAISVKEYEDGDEALGYEPHPFFRNWINEHEYNGVVSRDIAKYLGYYNEATNQIESKPNKDTTLTYKTWEEGRQIIKNTSESYGIMSWMFVDLFRMLCLIYFGRTDIHNLFDIPFNYTDNPDGRSYDELEQGAMTGTTDTIPSHTGFNTTSNHYKIFNIDHALAGITVDGCYQTNDGFYYSHLFDFDASKDENAIRSTLTSKVTTYDEEHDIITKMGYDENEPAFKTALAIRQATADAPLDSRQNIYYSAKQKLAPITESGARGQLYAFGWYTTILYPDSGVFFSVWTYWFDLAWGVRLCKAPF